MFNGFISNARSMLCAVLILNKVNAIRKNEDGLNKTQEAPKALNSKCKELVYYAISVIRVKGAPTNVTCLFFSWKHKLIDRLNKTSNRVICNAKLLCANNTGRLKKRREADGCQEK